jgi:uncharacterized repeat protein (TIGR01451 family)
MFFFWGLAALCLFIPDGVIAAGTPAGTIIRSRSVAIYTTASGTKSDTIYSTYVSFTVTQRAAINITPSSNALRSASDSAAVDYPIVLANSGNGSDVLLLSTSSSKGWSAQLFADVNGDGILQNSEIASGSVSRTSVLAADGIFKIILRITIPRDESLANQKDTATVRAISQFDGVAAAEGKYITTVQSANLSQFATALVVNPTVQDIGKTIIYSLTFSNTGTIPATNVVISSLIPSSLTYISASTSIGSSTTGTNPVLFTIGTLAPGASVTLSLTVEINNNAIPGSTIDNKFLMTYTVGTNTYSMTSNSKSVTVSLSQAYGVNVQSMWSSQSKESGDSTLYRFRITNSGAFKSVIELGVQSSQNLSWKLFRDGNNNGLFDRTDPLLANTNNFMGIDVDSVAAGDSVRIFALTILPLIKIDQVKDSLKVTGIIAAKTSIYSEATGLTTLNAPNILVSKSVSPVGDQPAGSIITYKISYQNSGHASVDSFSVVDATPLNTEYKSNSVQMNGIKLNDNQGPVSITSDNQNRKIISVRIGKLNPNTSGFIEFSVKVN